LPTPTMDADLEHSSTVVLRAPGHATCHGTARDCQ
jgi:hypothetical protein